MKISPFCFAVYFGLSQILAAQSDEKGFVPLFNGHDLSGWVNVNCSPDTWTVRDEMIVSTGKPTGVMRTGRQYENFILELDWKHIHQGGNAGLFLHSEPITAQGQPFTKSFEVQILAADDPKGMWTGHGDVFAIHGSTFVPDRPHPGGWMRCLPSEHRANPAGQWNHYRVESRDGRITLAVNGKVVSGGSQCHPRKGYICLESEGSECHFKNLRIKELPTSNPPASETASLDEGFTSLYNGADLSGWKQEGGGDPRWHSDDWVLKNDGRSDSKEKHLATEKQYGDFILIADWRLTRKPEAKQVREISPNGDDATNADGTPKYANVMDAGDSGIHLRGLRKAEVNIWSRPVGSGEIWGYRTDTNQPPEIRSGATPKLHADRAPGEWNRFIITLKGDRATVELNGQKVIDNARLPGIPPRGPIVLQHHGDPIEFANLYVKELN